MLEIFKNIFKIEELRNRIAFTLAMLVVFRLGAHIPVPGIDSAALAEFFNANRKGLLGNIDMFSGGAFRNMTIFALGIIPYISASIIMQLLTAVFPYFERLSKEGDAGRKKITQYTRYGTILLSVIQGFGIAAVFTFGITEVDTCTDGGDKARISGLPVATKTDGMHRMAKVFG